MSTPRILVIDDDEGLRRLFERQYGAQYALTFATSGAEAVQLLRDEPLDLIICDLALPDVAGTAILQKSKEIDQTVPVIVITAFGSINSAVEAMKLGAADYILKPFQRGEMSMVIERALEGRTHELERKRLREWAHGTYSLANIVGSSEKMRRVCDLVRRVADTPTTVLLQGESGTGKELFARAIHTNSRRSEQQFLAINCGALPESLLESELFGHVKGAFTGAVRTKKGLFEEASAGTILLDEISVVSQAVQAKLLRVLQEREVRRVGSNKSISIDTRVLAATNDDLKKLVERGDFREDLYFRLSVVPLRIPPLRERTEDIKPLLDHFLGKTSRKLGLEPKTFARAALLACHNYRWPGNVRELENLVERLLLTVEGAVIERADLPEEIAGDQPAARDDQQLLRDEIECRRLEVEHNAVKQALQQAQGNRTVAARVLGISRGSFYNRLRELREHGLEV